MFGAVQEDNGWVLMGIAGLSLFPPLLFPPPCSVMAHVVWAWGSSCA